MESELSVVHLLGLLSDEVHVGFGPFCQDLLYS